MSMVSQDIGALFTEEPWVVLLGRVVLFFFCAIVVACPWLVKDIAVLFTEWHYLACWRG